MTGPRGSGRVAIRSRPPPSGEGAETGTAAVLMAAVVAVTLMASLLVADAALYLAGRAKASAAADSAALAAAPLTFHGFGSAVPPADEARRFAATYGMTVVACDCEIDHSWAARTATVAVTGPVHLIVFGHRDVSARASAEFDPTSLVDVAGTDGILGGVDLTRLGHAAVLVEAARTRILIDPGAYSDTWHALSDLDAVLITHQHPDHVDAVNLIRTMAANSGARLLVEPDVVPLLAEHGLDAEAVSPGMVIGVGDLSVEVVGGHHALIHDRIPRIGNVGFVVSAGVDGPRFFHPGDAYDTVPERIDVLALPLTAPWATAGATADFLGSVGPAQAFPIHDATLSDLGGTAYRRIVGGITGNPDVIAPIDPSGSLSL